MNQTATVKNRVVAVSTATALASNTDRLGFSIQNVGTCALYVKLGTGATTSSYDFILQGGTTAADGKGGSFPYLNASVSYTGAITTAGNPELLYTAWEI